MSSVIRSPMHSRCPGTAFQCIVRAVLGGMVITDDIVIVVSGR